MRRVLALLVLASLVGCPSPGRKNGGGGGDGGGKPREISLFFTAELRGEIEPCGCNSDPLGDLARIAALLEDTRKARPVAWFDGGSTLYSEAPLSASKQAQERLKSDLLVDRLPKMGLTGAGLGPLDLADGKDKVRLARFASNVHAEDGVPLELARVVDVGGVKVGVVGVTAPAALAPLGLGVDDPAKIAAPLVKKLRGDGAQVVVLIAHMSRAEARKLARAAPGADFVLAGAEAPDPDARKAHRAIEPLEGGGWLVQPYQRGQSLVRVDLTVDAAGGVTLVDAVGEARARERIADLERDIADLREKLAAWEKDPTADEAFVEGKRGELAALEKERKELEAQPLRKPERGSWFVAEHVLVKKQLRCVPEVVAEKRALDARVGEANLAAFKDEKPPAVPAGGSAYVGREECVFCHKDAAEFWTRTKHASAFATIEKVGKQLDRYCVSCHVTGWLEPGGSVLVGSEALRDVQCEVCHGPGGKHVETDGKALDSLVVRAPEARCVKCHSPEHSDTFQYEAYLRDVTGPGHGEAFRKTLGDGTTGRELRKAALDKAGEGVGAGCGK
jgi:hypothetical protein